MKTDINKIMELYILNNNIENKDICVLGSGPQSLLDNIKSSTNKLNIDNFCEEF